MTWRSDIEAKFWAKTERRFLAQVEKQTGGCWLWQGRPTPGGGYGTFSVEDHPYLAHRVAYELWVGAIPEGLQIDHVRSRGCTNRLCVNPAHLEAVTQQENIRRSERVVKGTCKEDHPLSLEDSPPSARAKNYRVCRTCLRERGARYKREARARAKVSN